MLRQSEKHCHGIKEPDVVEPVILAHSRLRKSAVELSGIENVVAGEQVEGEDPRW